MTDTDLAAAIDAARAITDLTDAVCGSTSVEEYRNHLSHLDNERDNMASVVNLVIKEKHRWMDIERELKRYLDKLDDHRRRTASALKDLRSSYQSR